MTPASEYTYTQKVLRNGAVHRTLGMAFTALSLLFAVAIFFGMGYVGLGSNLSIGAGRGSTEYIAVIALGLIFLMLLRLTEHRRSTYHSSWLQKVLTRKNAWVDAIAMAVAGALTVGVGELFLRQQLMQRVSGLSSNSSLASSELLDGAALIMAIYYGVAIAYMLICLVGFVFAPTPSKADSDKLKRGELLSKD